MTPRVRYVVATLAVTAVAVGYVAVQGGMARPASRLERSTGAAAPRPPAPPPTASALIERSAALGLSAAQVTELERLARESSEETSGLEHATAAAGAELSRFLEARSRLGITVAELQARSADFRELSAALSAYRRQHGEAALMVLTDAQRVALARTPRRNVMGDR